MKGKVFFYRLRRRFTRMFSSGVQSLGTVAIGDPHRKVRPAIPASRRIVPLRFLRFPQTRSRRFLFVGVGFLALMLPVVIASLLFSQQTEAAWFDEAYGFRKRIPVANSSGSTQTDFQVELELDTASLITAGKLQNDCDDLRFTARDGKVLNYWLEPNTCNTATTKVFVKVPSISTSGADIFWYYGNAGASSASRTDGTFIAEMPGPVAAWPLDDTTTTQSYARVVNPGEAEGRDIILNGGFDSDTVWTKSAAEVTIANGRLLFTSSPSGRYAEQSLPLVPGKVYKVSYTISNIDTGAISIRARLGSVVNGTQYSAAGTYTETLLNTTATSLTIQVSGGLGNAQIDNVSVKQLNIPSSSTIATNLLSDGDMEASGTTSWTVANNATLTKQTASPYGGSQYLRVAYNGTNYPAARQDILTVGQAYRVSGYFRKVSGSQYAYVQNGTGVQASTTSTSWTSFDFVVVATDTKILLAGYTDTTAEFDSVTVTPDTTIRPGELLQDGNMEASGTGVWNANSAAVVTKQTGNPYSGSQLLRVATLTGDVAGQARQDILTAGKRYLVKGYARVGTATTAAVFVGSTGNSFTATTSTNWTYFERILTPVDSLFLLGTSGDGGYSEFDDVSVTEVSPLVSLPTNGVTLGASSGTGGHLATAYSFDGTNDNVNIYSSDLNSVFNPEEGTLVAWAKFTGSWSGSPTQRIVYIAADNTNNRIALTKPLNSANSIQVFYVAGGTTSSVYYTTSTTNWFQVVLTWSKSNDQVKMYFNGTQQGSTQTGLGTWSGNLSSTLNNIGATDTSGTNPWSGLINDVRLYDRVLSSTEVAALYSGSGDIQAYNTSNYTGTELLRKFHAGVTVGTLAAEEIGAAPVAYWKFDEGQGQTVQDVSGRGNNGTLGANSSVASDDPTWITEDQCVSGKCLRFDGGDSVTTTSNVSDLSSFSTSTWVKTTNVSATQKVLAQASGFAVQVDNSTGYKFDFAINTTTGWSSHIFSNQAVEANRWYHVATSYDGTTLKLYVDGILQNQTTTHSGSINSSAYRVTIGTYPGNDRWQGFIDEPKIYPYARSAAQVKEDFNQGAAKIGGQNLTFLSNGLVGYWKMDEASWNGTAAEVVDASGNGNHGVRVGDATTGVGKFGNGGTFDGTGDYINISTFQNLGLGTSFATWVYTGDTTNIKCLVSGRTYSMEICLTSDGNRISLSTRNSIGTWFTETSNPDLVVAADTWAHIAGVVTTEGELQIYLNGSKVCSGSCTTTGSLITTNALYLGRDDTGSYLNGKLDETRIYNRALSPAEVADLYNYAPGPVGHWKFDEGTGTNAVDSSGNGNNGTLENSPQWANGKFGKALSFDGTSNRVVRVPDSTQLQFNSTSFTVSAWTKPNVAKSSAIVRKGVGTRRRGYGFNLTDSNIVQAMYSDTDDSGDHLVQGGNVPVGQWSYITQIVNRDTQTMQLFVNGVSIGSMSIAGITSYNSGYDLFIGDDGAYDANAVIDDVRIYNYARTPQQILEDMGGSSSPSITGSTLPDPIAHYKLDEQSGQTANNAGSGGSALNGTLGANSSASTDDPTWKTNADCKVNGCASFDGGDWVSIADNNSLDLTSGVTLSSRVNLGSSLSGYETILGKRDVTNNESNYTLRTGSGEDSDEIEFYFANSGWNIYKTSNAGLQPNTWYHIVAVHDSSAPRIYINGELKQGVCSGNCSQAMLADTNSLAIGRPGDNNQQYMNGLIDDVKIYNVALSEDQVRLDMNAGSSLDFGAKAEPEASLLSDGAGAPPVAEWKFDEKQGTTANDSSGNGRTGTLTNGPAWGLGKVGSAVQFDGVNDYVEAGDVLDMGTADMTISLWLKSSSTINQYIVSKSKAASQDYRYGVGINSGSGQLFMKGNGNSDVLLNGSKYIADGSWHFMTYVYKRDGFARIYADGKFDSQATISQWIGQDFQSSNPFRIGSYTASDNTAVSFPFSGSIDHVKIYNYARTPAQIAYDFNRGAPIAHWKLNECEGTTINDSSGNDNAGTLTVGGSGSQTAVGTCDTAGSAWANGKTGKFGASMNFDGTDDYALMSDSTTLDLTSSVSLAGWFNANSLGNYRTIVGKRHASSTSANYVLRTGTGANNDELEFYFVSGSSYQIYTTSNANLTPASWNHVVVAYSEGAPPKIYLNGRLLAGTCTQNSCNGPMTIDSNPVAIGRPGNLNNEYFSGQIDDVRIYNYALSPEQVATVKNEGAAMRFGE